jgi:hypothetical protein
MEYSGSLSSILPQKADHYHFSGLLVGASLRLLNMALSFKERIGDKEIRLF